MREAALRKETGARQAQRDLRVTEWQDAVRGLARRAEDLAQPGLSFVRTAFYDSLKAERNQSVSGRRGTGKTHLFRSLYDEYATHFKEHHVVPVHLSGTVLRQSVKTMVQHPPAVGFVLYAEFVRELARLVCDYICREREPRFPDDALGKEHREDVRRARLVARELHQALAAGKLVYLPGADQSDETLSVAESAERIGGRSAVADPACLGWDISAGVPTIEYKELRAIVPSVIKGRLIITAVQAMALVRSILDLLGQASLVVLFDDWSEVDVDVEIQPYLAEMLRRAFGPGSRVRMKFACVPARTRFSTFVSGAAPSRIGFEENEDIFHDIDLDSATFTDIDLRQSLLFHALLLKEHVGSTLEWVREMDYREFEELLCSELFEGVEVFAELCRASAGVPRDFLVLARESIRAQQFSRSDSIGFRHVRFAASEFYGVKRRSLDPEGFELLVLDRIYRDLVVPKRSRLFLVPERMAARSETNLLWTERLIHRLPWRHYDAEAMSRSQYFVIDYGCCADQPADAGPGDGLGSSSALLSEFRPGEWFTELREPVRSMSFPRLTEWAEQRITGVGRPEHSPVQPAELTVRPELFQP
jgi:hypothetical protein